ncbi:MAG: hypothetical protein IPK16_31950 [Anaerolineales bacterium]|nr:hypothetical protein [Anaerolineales bacterium]
MTTPASQAGGAGAIYVNAARSESIAYGIMRLATDDGLRRQLRTAGQAHAATFTWENSARQLLAAYQRVQKLKYSGQTKGNTLIRIAVAPR